MSDHRGAGGARSFMAESATGPRNRRMVSQSILNMRRMMMMTGMMK